MPQVIVVVSKGSIELRDVPMPVAGPHEIVVKVHTAALNAMDWWIVDHILPNANFVGMALGGDFAGTVDSIGPGVPAGTRSVGERVCGFIRSGSSPTNGAFGEYVVIDANLVIHVPDDIPFEEAAGVASRALVAAQMMWQSQSLPKIGSPPSTQPFLVWSAASSVGHYLVQLARMAGLRVIATASPQHATRVTALGAAEVFDYRAEDVQERIRAQVGDTLRSAAICVGDQKVLSTVIDCFGEKGGVVSVIGFVNQATVPAHVKAVFSSAGTLFGQAQLGPGGVVIHPAHPEHYADAVRWCKFLGIVLAKKKVIPAPTRVFGRLDSAAEAMAFMKSGKVSSKTPQTPALLTPSS